MELDPQQAASGVPDDGLASLRRDVAALQRERRPTDRMARAVQTLIFGVIMLLLVVLVITTVLALLASSGPDTRTLVVIGLPRTSPEISVLTRAEEVLDSAEIAAEGANRVLSFLEAMGVLVALALGAAAIYGFRNTQQIREELARDRERIEKELSRIESMRDQLEQHRDDLRSLPQHIEEVRAVRAEVDRAQAELQSVQPFFTDLLLANQELLVNNYQEAYRAVQRVLAQAPANPMALYIAGWIELQYIPARLELGVEHLRQFYQENPTWPIAKAVYGVVLRRQATKLPQPQQENMFNQAHGLLLEALGENPGLLDLNRESLWGPVGGILRRRGQYAAAKEAYERACRVTPGSSYPHGNLASLLLLEARDSADPDAYAAKQRQALDTFRSTLALARAELAIEPNDYFHVMDIAMATLMLNAHAGGDGSRSGVDEAYVWLGRALEMQDVTAEMLRVSLRGWRNLLEFAPDRPEWQAARQHLAWAAHSVALALVQRALRDEQADAEALQALSEDALDALMVALRAEAPVGHDEVRGRALELWRALEQACPDDWQEVRAVIREAVAQLQPEAPGA